MRRNPTERWWKVDEDKVHNAVFSTASLMETEQSERRQENALLRTLYRAKGYAASPMGDLMPNFSPLYASGEQVWSYNLLRTAIETLEARLALGRPKASFVTNGGGWAQQRRARRADRFVYGVMHACGFYKQARLAWRDAAVTDLGVIKGWVENGCIRLQRVDPDEIRVDSADGYYGEPRTMLHSYVVSRDQAHAWVDAWNEDKSEEQRAFMHVQVDSAAVASSQDRTLRVTSAFGDVVQVHEAWHLPSGPEAEDGRHVLALSTVALLDEGCNFFPFAPFRAGEPFHGFYGQGLGELLVPHQRAINATLRRVSKIIHNMATSRWWVDRTTQIATEHVGNNESATVLRGAGKPPQVLASNVVPSDLWRWVDYAIQRGLEQVGLNEGAVASRKPAGLDSGKALREFNDIQSSRHVPIQLGFEEGVLESARLVVRLARKAAEDGERLTAFYPAGVRRSVAVDWNEVAVDEDTFTLQVFSTASLPTTPGARKQYVAEQWTEGQIDGAEYRRLLDMPDTDAFDDLALAARDVVDAALERMLDGDDDEGAEEDYTPPEPFDDLAYAVKRGMQVYHRARVDGAPEGRLSLVRRYILQAKSLADSAQDQQPPSPQQQPTPAAPPQPEPQAAA